MDNHAKRAATSRRLRNRNYLPLTFRHSSEAYAPENLSQLFILGITSGANVRTRRIRVTKAQRLPQASDL